MLFRSPAGAVTLTAATPTVWVYDPAAPEFHPRAALVDLLGSALMVATGLAFPQLEHIAFIGIVAFVGTINPQTGDSGILVPLEHAMLARGVAGLRDCQTRRESLGAFDVFVRHIPHRIQSTTAAVDPESERVLEAGRDEGRPVERMVALSRVPTAGQHRLRDRAIEELLPEPLGRARRLDLPDRRAVALGETGE